MQHHSSKQTPSKAHKRHSSQVAQQHHQGPSQRMSAQSSHQNVGYTSNVKAVQQAVYVESVGHQNPYPKHAQQAVNQSVRLDRAPGLDSSSGSLKDPSKIINQFNKGTLKKSDLKLLQKCKSLR